MDGPNPFIVVGLVVSSAHAFVPLHLSSDNLGDGAYSASAIHWALSIHSTSTSHWSFGHPGPYTFA
jgi:hypothetical protein